MDLTAANERLATAVGVAGSPDASPAELRAALAATTQVQSFIASVRAELVRALDARPTAFPEADIADTSKCSLGEATREKERADTLGAAAAMADALADGVITPGHVDALTRNGKRLDDAGRAGLLDLDEELAAEAASRSIADFDRWLKKKAASLDRTDADERLERQRRAIRVRHWTGDDGMWNIRGQFDPQTGLDLARLIDGAADSVRTAGVPDGGPTDPGERAGWLEGLGLAGLLGVNPGGLLDAAAVPATDPAASPSGRPSNGSGASATVRPLVPSPRPGPPLVVIDATQTDATGGPLLDWGHPVELPRSILDQLAGTTDPDVVVVCNGIVLHAPGRLNLRRSSRVANRAQRRALAGLYSTCAVPGCQVRYDRCRLHHVIFWRNGGLTDLANLLPICQHHHTRLHDDGWEVTLGPNRELTIRLPGGRVLSSGPPRRSAA